MFQQLHERLDRVWRRWEQRTGKLAPRQPEHLAYATHLPILLALPRLLRVERVLELGSGLFSTLAFTNHAAYPDLKFLRTVENDPAWSRQMKERVAGDTRIEFIEWSGSVEAAVGEMDLSGFDLIFVDDSARSDDREATIRRVAWQKRNGVVAIHDFEHFPYRRAARGFKQLHRFTAFHPNTAVAWTGDRLSGASLPRLDQVLRTAPVRLDDPAAWIAFLDQQIPLLSPARRGQSSTGPA